jgi:hypothetical protein
MEVVWCLHFLTNKKMIKKIAQTVYLLLIINIDVFLSILLHLKLEFFFHATGHRFANLISYFRDIVKATSASSKYFVLNYIPDN